MFLAHATSPGGASPRRIRLGFWAVAAAFATVMAFSAVPTPLYAIYAQRDGFGSLTVTLIFASYAVGVIASLFLAGHVSDWHGRRRVLVTALLVSAVSATVFLVWRDLPGLVVARFVNGLAVGAVTATATAWLAELHRERSEVVAVVANLGGIGVGPLVSGALAQWVGAPLTVPYAIFVVLLLVATALLVLTPETRMAADPRPRYRPQRVSVPAHARPAFAAAAVGALVAFAALALFTSLAPSFLAGTLHHRSHALAGLAAFVVFAASAATQLVVARWPRRAVVALGAGALTAGAALTVVALWLPSPSLVLFLAGGVVSGVGVGSIVKGAVGTVVAISEPHNRAEAVAGLFLAGYLGLALPVLGLGFLTQELEARVAVLVFAAVLVAGLAAALPRLLSDGARAPRPALQLVGEGVGGGGRAAARRPDERDHEVLVHPGDRDRRDADLVA
jgi:MFS family permease